MAFAAVVELSGLGVSTGIQINGEVASDQSGFSVSWAGDINGDGFDDIIIGAPYNDVSGTYSGAAYVVFGKAGGFAVNIELSALNGTNGFLIEGRALNEQAGWWVSGAGDVNNDGIDDLVVGARWADLAGVDSGAAFVVYGKTTAFAASFDLANINGTNGFRVTGEVAADEAGWVATSAGDLNGDGIDDMVVSGRLHDANTLDAAGSVYVIFGKSTAFSTTTALGSLTGTNGFRINGEVANDQAGFSVASAGDVNGDGLDDLIIGAKYADPNGSNSGAAYVVFGKTTAWTADLNLSDLNGTNGFQLNGALASDFTGGAVSRAGDINGDGIDDILIGAETADPNAISNSGAVYVVFGKTTAWAANVSLAALSGTDGFRIAGELNNDRLGHAVSWAGDVNGDGLDDLIVGAYVADVNGTSSGSVYVIYGRSTAFAANLNLTALDGTNGFQINGEFANDQAGRSVSGVGDMNRDGLADIIIGSRGSDVNGGSSGSSFVVFGQLSGEYFNGTGIDDVHDGGVWGDRFTGGGGKDILSGFGAYDILDGGDANDVLYGGDAADWLIGGTGNDWLQGDGGNDDLDGGTGADKLFGNLGNDDLSGEDGNDRIEGGDGIDTLTGADGNDYLDGGAGADSMTGGLGNDVYLVDDAADIVVEGLNAGYDIVRASVDDWVLGANFEGLELQGSADIDGTGNALANNIQGNDGNNRLDGGAGVDTINGNDGDDIIVGGLAGDQLRGGLGADTFVVAHAFAGALETDQVYDFSTAEGDIVDLSGVDANTSLANDQAFTVVAAFSKVAGQMTVTVAGGATLVKLDVNGDGKADYQMKIAGDVSDGVGDWVL